MRDFFHFHDPVSFAFPIDGDCLNVNDGRVDGDALFITVKIRAAENAQITVNNIPAKFDSDERLFIAEVPLYNYRNSLYAIDSKNGARADVVVYRFHDPIKKYYITVDDTIVFLYDLNKNPDKYPSMFDHPFLAPFKKAHDLYGAHTHLNLYYEYNEDSARDFHNHQDYFNLSMMTDKFKPEFEANADWLTLSYHAHANYPSMPGKIHSAEFFSNSMHMVHKEIKRFAGEKSLVPATNVHFGNGYVEILRAFRDNGYRIMFDSFRYVDDDEPCMGYYGRDGLYKYIRGSGVDPYNRESSSADNSNEGRNCWKDNIEDVIYCRLDIVLNSVKLDDIEPWMDKYLSLRPNSGMMNPMIHEEYFYPDYINYIPDCGERILKAAKYLYDRGYKSVPIQDIVLE